ncbi:MAG TPA: tripartite tricarboxylate transporter TctB family protein [Ramlibacter sp.]|uniref:tripartite tricarboxylate transporter TctB family protein n=1 Tax=Ramlibacter sp. TaxID=1917967 RepID=UPI002CB362F3|nr:tripartite tricarboxylate transporter TctB family protein [Ramlibacter sp.]HVZ44741.1 tripartite tricarboxylate transporter TctB family protein [Ramlibacter sp.]
MSDIERSDSPERRGVATWIVEGAVALLILAFGLTVIFGSRKLGSGWTSDGPGAGYFPFYIGLILSVSSLGTLWQTVIAKRNTEIFVDHEQLKQVLVVFIPGLVYVLAVRFLGLYVASSIYIAGFMIVLGKYSPVKSIVAAVAIGAIFFAMFEVWFKVPLYKGTLDPLSFLGY